MHALSVTSLAVHVKVMVSARTNCVGAISIEEIATNVTKNNTNSLLKVFNLPFSLNFVLFIYALLSKKLAVSYKASCDSRFIKKREVSIHNKLSIRIFRRYFSAFLEMYYE